jgi:hypothetical protein
VPATTAALPPEVPAGDEADGRHRVTREERRPPVLVPDQPPTVPNPVLAGAAPAAPLAPPAPAPATPTAGPHLAIAETAIDLGRAGRRARKGRPIRLLNTGAGQLKGIVHVTQPWLAASAVQFQGNVGELMVRSRGRGLRLGRRVLPVPNLFRWAGSVLRSALGRWALIGWLALSLWVGAQWGLGVAAAGASGIGILLALLILGQVWIWLVARHVRWLVPTARLNTGEVIIDSNGGQHRVTVQVLAEPSWPRRAIAWFVVSALLVAELMLAVTVLATQVLRL